MSKNTSALRSKPEIDEAKEIMLSLIQTAPGTESILKLFRR